MDQETIERMHRSAAAQALTPPPPTETAAGRPCMENETWGDRKGRVCRLPNGHAGAHVWEPRNPEEPVHADDLETASAPESGRWEFDAAVTAAFDDMLSRSIPNYEDMRLITTRAALRVFDAVNGNTHGGLIVDLGASRGAALQPLVDKLGVRAQYRALEISDPMLEALQERFKGWTDYVGVEKADLREGLKVKRPASVYLSVLTLQFLPIEYRQELLRSIYDSLLPGGGLILVEKVLGESPEAQRLLTDLYWDRKRDQGYTEEAIQRKAMSLEGVLVPLTASINEAWLRAAGFEVVEVIWAWANFRAWLAVKR